MIVPNQAIATYVAQWTYDSHNRLLEVIYPDEEKITYSYNLGGQLEKVHVSRHTFATMELTMGADLYTTSKLLGHTEVRTTQIYAKIINKKKDEAVSLLDSAFEE